jgi:hypothetical protein
MYVSCEVQTSSTCRDMLRPSAVVARKRVKKQTRFHGCADVSNTTHCRRNCCCMETNNKTDGVFYWRLLGVIGKT